MKRVNSEGVRLVGLTSRGSPIERWKTGRELFTLTGHSGRVYGCAISGDEKRVVSGSPDQTVKVWDLETGKCVATLVVDSPLYDCAMSADGAQIVAAGARGVYFLKLMT
ncbi:MAG TPA: hypothetical protein VJX67_10070 [Blastocatellia bacterium]|nr:hypothetical protein [Blastocatellia bacterium]